MVLGSLETRKLIHIANYTESLLRFRGLFQTCSYNEYTNNVQKKTKKNRKSASWHIKTGLSNEKAMRYVELVTSLTKL